MRGAGRTGIARRGRLDRGVQLELVLYLVGSQLTHLVVTSSRSRRLLGRGKGAVCGGRTAGFARETRRQRADDRAAVQGAAVGHLQRLWAPALQAVRVESSVEIGSFLNALVHLRLENKSSFSAAR